MKTIDEQLEEALARITKFESDATASTSLLTEAGHQHERYRQEIAALTKEKETLTLANGELTEQRDQLSRDLATAKQSLTSAATAAEELTKAKEQITALTTRSRNAQGQREDRRAHRRRTLRRGQHGAAPGDAARRHPGRDARREVQGHHRPDRADRLLALPHRRATHPHPQRQVTNHSNAQHTHQRQRHQGRAERPPAVDGRTAADARLLHQLLAGAGGQARHRARARRRRALGFERVRGQLHHERGFHR